MKDAVIVSGGLAGLSAAWRLRNWDVTLLESGSRVGGRIRSGNRGRYFLNWGGHMFSVGKSSTNELITETETRTSEIPGTLSAVSTNGKLIIDGPVQSYPFRIPMSLKDRASMIKAAVKVSDSVLRYANAVRLRPNDSSEMRQRRIYDFENDRSCADCIGELSEDAEENIDFDVLGRVVDRSIDGGVDGLVVAQTGATTTSGAVRQSKAAQTAGTDVLMIVTPYYEPLTSAETLGCIRRVAGAANVVPAEIVSVSAKIAARELAGASEEWKRHYPVIDAMISEPLIQSVKAGLELQGEPVGSPRRPMADTDPDARERIKNALAELKG